MMDLKELLEMMVDMAKTDNTSPCLGIRVCSNGSGHTTPGARPGHESIICDYGKSYLKWDTPAEGAIQLEREIRLKHKAELEAAEAAKHG